MPGFGHILFPVDFSDRCSDVRPFVLEMARRFHSKITLLHVVQLPTAWSGAFDGGYPIMFDLPGMERAARSELKTFLGPEIVAEQIVKVGDPATEIVQFAERDGVDLIMLPTHGYGKFRNLLLGSVTAKVLHDAKCPVWTATHTEDPAVRKHLQFNNIMGAIDITPESVPLIRRYAEFAADFHARLRLVHAVPGAVVDTYYGLDPEFQRFLLRSAREEIAKLQVEAGTSLEVCMEGGTVPDIVRAAAIHHDADLVLIGRGGLQEKFGELRTNAYAIIRDAPCPVLSI